MYTTWNMAGWDGTNGIEVPEIPSVLTSGLYDDYEELIAITGKSYFLGVKLNNNNEVTNAYACGVKDGTPFCIEGYSDGSKYTANQELINGANLWNNTCDIQTESVIEETVCGPWNGSGYVSSIAFNDGYVQAGVSFGDDDGFDAHYCSVSPNGSFACVES